MDLRLRASSQADSELQITILDVGGEIDLHSAPRLRAEFLRLSEAVPEAQVPRLVVNLREVSFIDSTGIGVLVGALKRARERGGSVHFSGSQSRVKRVFEITGLLRALPLFENREDAIQAFQSAPAPIEAATGDAVGVETHREVQVEAEQVEAENEIPIETESQTEARVEARSLS